MNPPIRSFASRLAHGAAPVACFFAAFAGACALLARVTPFPDVSAITDKMKVFEQQHAQSDVIFVGSSRFFHQIIPADFDAAAAQAGRPVHSFNFGQDGTWPPESLYVLDHLLKLRAPRLKWVFIELMRIEGALHEGNDETPQARYWHDRAHTNMAERAVLDLPLTWSAKLALCGRHEMLWLKRASNFGSGQPLLKKALWGERARGAHLPGWAGRAGYRPGPSNEITGREREHFLKAAEYVRQEAPSQHLPLPDSLRAPLHRLTQEIRRHGAEPIFVISPSLHLTGNFTETPDGARLISFSRPDLYPELYRPENYFDFVHLNPKGAAIYSRLLAEKFVELTADAP